MKKHFKFLMLALLALMPLALISCGDDDDDNNSSSKTIQINGKSYELDPYVVSEGSFDAEDGTGEFVVGVVNQVGNSKDSWGYRFSYTDTAEPKAGDDFSKKSLEMRAEDESAAVYSTLTYKSGSAKVVSINKSNDEMTIKFSNLKMADDEYSYTFNGTATVDFNFAE